MPDVVSPVIHDHAPNLRKSAWPRFLGSAKHVIGDFGRGAGSLLFTPSCVECGDIVEWPRRHTHAGKLRALRHVCKRCASHLIFANEPCCETCGHPFYGVLAGTRVCEHCQGLSPIFNEGRTAVLFKNAARTLVHELKYHRALYVLRDIETIFKSSDRIMELARGSVLVPVPLHARKERERGYNQALLIAECLARAAGGNVTGTRVQMLLRRVHDTVSQTALDRDTRRTNLKNAFSLTPRALINPALHYIIIDDVFTTGSTLNSCAGVLRRAGCANVDVITFGHG